MIPQPKPVNIVAYRYENVGGMDYLTDIYDTPPAANPTSAPLTQYAHHTVLRYETRPDATFTYRRGWRVDQTLRLIGIDVASMPFLGGGTVRHQVRRYHLSYDPSYHVSLLTQVQMEGRCVGSIDLAGGGGEAQAPAEASEQLPASTNCDMLPPITLGYQHVTPYNVDGSPGSADLTGYEGFDERPIFMSQSPPNSIDEQMTDLFDINADGLPDVVQTFPGQDSKFPLYLNGLPGGRELVRGLEARRPGRAGRDLHANQPGQRQRRRRGPRRRRHHRLASSADGQVVRGLHAAARQR